MLTTLLATACALCLPHPSAPQASGAEGQEIGLTDQAQGEPGPARPKLPDLPRLGSKPILAVDGKAVAPGRIPEGTAPAAQALWKDLLAANKSQTIEGPIAPIRSFDMTFSARIRQKNASNDLDVRFLFLEEGRGFLKAIMTQSHRQSMRGPEGDWLFDKGQWIRLQGREDRESTRELDRWVAISRNFIGLTQAKGIRLVELRALRPAPNAQDPLRIDFPGEADRLTTTVMLPSKKHAGLAKDLRWLEVTSPDFGLYDTGRESAPGQARLYRGTLGLNPAGQVLLAQFEELHQGRALPQGALFVEVETWIPRPSGYVLPNRMYTFKKRGPLRFEERPSTDLFLNKTDSRINPAYLTAANFVLPAADQESAPR